VHWLRGTRIEIDHREATMSQNYTDIVPQTFAIGAPSRHPRKRSADRHADDVNRRLPERRD